MALNGQRRPARIQLSYRMSRCASCRAFCELFIFIFLLHSRSQKVLCLRRRRLICIPLQHPLSIFSFRSNETVG